MSVVRTPREVWYCTDCALSHCNGDTSGLDDARYVEIVSGERRVAALGYVSADDNGTDGVVEFTSASCFCCRTRLAGERRRFALWPHAGKCVCGRDLPDADRCWSCLYTGPVTITAVD